MFRSKLVLIAFVASASFLHADDHSVDQVEKEFSPAAITVKVGDTITFKNSDSVAHNMFSTSAQNAFNVAIQKPGEICPVAFKEEGVTEIKCAIHPKMKIVVTVTK